MTPRRRIAYWWHYAKTVRAGIFWDWQFGYDKTYYDGWNYSIWFGPFSIWWGDNA